MLAISTMDPTLYAVLTVAAFVIFVVAAILLYPLNRVGALVALAGAIGFAAIAWNGVALA